MDHDIDEARTQHFLRDVPEKAASGDDSSTTGFGDSGKPQAFDTTHCLFTNADEGRATSEDFRLERSPTHSRIGASRISTDNSRLSWRNIAAMDAKAKGGQKALAELLKGQ